MMEELCAHIMDLLANSVSAQAHHIEVHLVETRETGQLVLKIIDNGIGMNDEMAQKVQSPFFSTKLGRKVGLGIPLLKGTAETTGGTFSLRSTPGKGTEITATFNTHHPDLPPVGNLKDTILVSVISNPDIDFTFLCRYNGVDFTLNTTEIKDILGGVPINHPEVINFLAKYIDEHL